MEPQEGIPRVLSAQAESEAQGEEKNTEAAAATVIGSGEAEPSVVC